LLAKLGWANAHIIGYSFGASTAASFVALHPQHAESVTILAPAGLLKVSNLTEEQQRLTAGGDGVDEQAAEDFILDFINGGPLVLAADWKARFVRGEISGGPIQAVLKTFLYSHSRILSSDSHRSAWFSCLWSSDFLANTS
jgi:pimeloyl-ACP methyl ester carboxylesterase